MRPRRDTRPRVRAVRFPPGSRPRSRSARRAQTLRSSPRRLCRSQRSGDHDRPRVALGDAVAVVEVQDVGEHPVGARRADRGQPAAVEQRSRGGAARGRRPRSRLRSRPTARAGRHRHRGVIDQQPRNAAPHLGWDLRQRSPSANSHSSAGGGRRGRRRGPLTRRRSRCRPIAAERRPQLGGGGHRMPRPVDARSNRYRGPDTLKAATIRPCGSRTGAATARESRFHLLVGDGVAALRAESIRAASSRPWRCSARAAPGRRRTPARAPSGCDRTAAPGRPTCSTPAWSDRPTRQPALRAGTRRGDRERVGRPGAPTGGRARRASDTSRASSGLRPRPAGGARPPGSQARRSAIQAGRQACRGRDRPARARRGS